MHYPLKEIQAHHSATLEFEPIFFLWNTLSSKMIANIMFLCHALIHSISLSQARCILLESEILYQELQLFTQEN